MVVVASKEHHNDPIKKRTTISDDRLSKDFFSDPTQAAVTCVKTGKVELAKSMGYDAVIDCK